MADFAPQRGGQPIRTVITVAELLGRRNGSAGATDTGRSGARTAVPVGALMRREGHVRPALNRPVGPRPDRAVPGFGSSPRRKLATSAGALVALGSMAGMAAFFGETVPGTTGSSALDGGFPQGGVEGSRVPGGPLVNPDGTISPVGFPSVLPPSPLPAPGAASVPGQTIASPTVNGLVPGAAPVSSLSSGGGSGGAVGGLANGVVGGGGSAVGNTVSELGRNLGPLGAPVDALGQTVGGTSQVLGRTVDRTVGTVGATASTGVRTVTGVVGAVGPLKPLAGTAGRTVRGLTEGLLGGGRDTVKQTRNLLHSSGKSATKKSRSTADSALSSLTKPITSLDASDRRSADRSESRSGNRSESKSREKRSGSDPLTGTVRSLLGDSDKKSNRSSRSDRDDDGDGDQRSSSKSSNNKSSSKSSGKSKSGGSGGLSGLLGN